MSSSTGVKIGVACLICAIVLAVAGAFEWSQTKSCGASASPSCQSGKRLHPKRAEALWAAAAVFAIAGGAVLLTSRRSAYR
jgi:hypothetical protein